MSSASESGCIDLPQASPARSSGHGRIEPIIENSNRLPQRFWLLALPNLIAFWNGIQIFLRNQCTICASSLLAALPMILLGQPARLSYHMPPSALGAYTSAERFWTSRSEEAKMMAQVIGILLPWAARWLFFTSLLSDLFCNRGVVTHFYTSGGGWPVGDALLQLSFAMLAVSLVMQCIVMFYSNAMQIPGRYRHWVEDMRARTPVTFTLDPWVVLSIPTVWSLWSFVIVCLTTLVSAWRPSDVIVLVQPVNFTLVVLVAGVLILGGLCSFVLIVVGQRWISSRHDDDVEQ